MKKRYLVFIATALSVSMIAGCAGYSSTENNQTNNGSDVSSDLEEAKKVADMIDAIYVQNRTDETDEQCAAAKKAWDALTDKQKELVEGEYANPDYFGKDTGDASKDNPLNNDEIGENEILVVSFGTSFNDSRVLDIGSIEKAIVKAYPDWSVRRAFTSQIIINHIQARDNEKIDNVKQALERAVSNGVKNLVVQPTHLMHGVEYDEITSALDSYKDKFESVTVAEPLLGETGENDAAINLDKEAVAKAITEQTCKDAGINSVKAAADENIAFVFLGHGTSHTAKITYTQMQEQMKQLEYNNVFVGTVEGEPESTSCEAVIEEIKKAGYTKVYLRPLMVVAGDHANNDMAGDEDDSWKSMFTASGSFESVETQIIGLGGIEAIQNIYVEHTQNAISELGSNVNAASNSSTDNSGSKLEDGEYNAKFKTDSSMFHVNEANKDTGKLTVKNGKMTIHVSLASDGIVKVFAGTAKDAQKVGANVIEPSEDTVTYNDGSTETVSGFDIPVPYIGKEFDVAILGKKGKWYDHKVSVSDAVKTQ